MLQSAETCELLYGAALQGTTLASPTWQIASGSVVLTANRAAPRLVHHTPIQPRSSPGLSRVLSATGRDDPRATCAELLGRALAALPAPARAGRIRLRDAGYFAGQLARAALLAGVEFAIGARRTAPLWRLLDGVPDQAWTDAIDMTGAQVAVADYCPNWWPATIRLLIRRVRLDLDHGQVSTDPRARRRRTLHPDQRALLLDELAEVDGVFAYSFIVTNLDVSTGVKAAAAATGRVRCGGGSTSCCRGRRGGRLRRCARR